MLCVDFEKAKLKSYNQYWEHSSKSFSVDISYLNDSGLYWPDLFMKDGFIQDYVEWVRDSVWIKKVVQVSYDCKSLFY